MARHLNLSVPAFGRKYLRRVEGRRSLLEHPNGDCIFFKDRGCIVYPLRPRQCRTFPFWPENLRSRRAWEELKDECPGVGKGRLFLLKEIQLIRRGRGEAARGNGKS